MDRGAIRSNTIRKELPAHAFNTLPPMPPPFVDLDGTVHYSLSDVVGATGL
jgi:hypothetical protein